MRGGDLGHVHVRGGGGGLQQRHVALRPSPRPRQQHARQGEEGVVVAAYPSFLMQGENLCVCVCVCVCV